MSDYVPDHLYERLFQPWTLPEAEWPLCKEDWARVDAITRLPWKGRLLDFGAGDGTLAAMVCSRNPLVTGALGIEIDGRQIVKSQRVWAAWPITLSDMPIGLAPRFYDGALCCEVLEHMTPEQGHMTLKQIHAVLKPGAMLCVTVPNVAGPRATYPGHIREFDIAELGRTVAAAGFRVEDGDAIGGKVIPVWFMAVARA